MFFTSIKYQFYFFPFLCFLFYSLFSLLFCGFVSIFLVSFFFPFLSPLFFPVYNLHHFAKRQFHCFTGMQKLNSKRKGKSSKLLNKIAYSFSKSSLDDNLNLFLALSSPSPTHSPTLYTVYTNGKKPEIKTKYIAYSMRLDWVFLMRFKVLTARFMLCEV